jgi:hypothetical protein
MTHIENGLPYYAWLYGELMGDKRIAALAEEEARALPKIKDPKGRPLSIVQRTAIAREIRNKELRSKYRNGTLTEEEARKYIGTLSEGNLKQNSAL